MKGDVLSPLLFNRRPLGGSISPCYRACETARLRRAFVCNNGFSLFSFVVFLCHCILFSVGSFAVIKVQYYMTV